MSIALTTNTTSYTSTGGTVYTIPFRYDDVTTIYARTRASDGSNVTRKYIGIDYTVSAPTATGGTLTFFVAPTAGLIVDILRWVQPVQNASFQRQGLFPAASFEEALDLLTMQVQQLIDANFVGSTAPVDPWTYIGGLPGQTVIPDGSITPAKLNLTGTVPIVSNVQFQVTKLTYGSGTTATAESITANAQNATDGYRGTDTVRQAQVQGGGTFQVNAYPSRDSVAQYTDNTAPARYGGSGATSAYTPTTITATDWTIPLSRVLVGMLIDTLHATKLTGTVVSVDVANNKVTVDGWYVNGGTQGQTGTPADGTGCIVNPVTHIWAHNAGVFFNSHSDTYTTNGTGFELDIVNLASATPVIWGYDSVNIGAPDGAPTWSASVSYTTGQYVSLAGIIYVAAQDSLNHTPPNATYWTPNGYFKNDAMYVARGCGITHYLSGGARDSAFWCSLLNGNTSSPTVAFLDTSNSTTSIRVTGGSHSNYFLFEDASAVLVSGLTNTGIFTIKGIENRSNAGMPYIDFSNDLTVDYDWRFIENSKQSFALIAKTAVGAPVINILATDSGGAAPFFVGINKATPVVALDVVGAIAATTTLLVGTTSILTGNTTIGTDGYTGHLILGTYHIWVSSGGKVYIKNGVPVSDTDGVVVGSQS